VTNRASASLSRSSVMRFFILRSSIRQKAPARQ
jgi:hypothetical protein